VNTALAQELGHRVFGMSVDESSQPRSEVAIPRHDSSTGIDTEVDTEVSVHPVAGGGRPVVEPPTPSRSFWTRIDRPFLFCFLLTLVGLSAVLVALTPGSLSSVLFYIAFALFAALGLAPAVRFLERRGMSRGLSVLSVILGLVAALALVMV